MRVAVIFKRDVIDGCERRFAAQDAKFTAWIPAIQIPDYPQTSETRYIPCEPKRVFVVGKRRQRDFEPTGDARHPRDKRMGNVADFLAVYLDVVTSAVQNLAQNGQIVVALLGDEATVKTLKRKGSEVWLMPANPDYQPIDGRECTILGRVVAVVRQY